MDDCIAYFSKRSVELRVPRVIENYAEMDRKFNEALTNAENLESRHAF